MSRRHLVLLFGLLALLSLLAWSRLHERPETRHITLANTSAPTATPALRTALPRELQAILNEPDEVLRLHLLTRWAETRTVEEIQRAWLASVGGTLPRHITLSDHPLLQLAYDKQADQNPEASEIELMRLQHSLIFSGPHRPEAGDHIQQLIQLSQTDPAAAFREALHARLPGRDRAQTLADILAHATRQDPRLALRLIGETAVIPRRQAFAAVAKAWAETDPAAALEWAGQQPASSLQNNFVRTVIETWADADLSAALETATTLTAAHDLDSTVETLLHRWLRASPDASAQWIQTQDSPSRMVLMAAVNTLSGTHPRLIATLLSRPMDEATRAGATAVFVGNWSRTNPSSALLWINTLPRGGSYDMAVIAIIGNLARRDPSAALSLYQSLPDDTTRASITSSLAANLPDRSAAFSWLTSLPAGKLRQAAADGLASQQYSKDPAGFTTWLATLPDPESQAAAARSVAYWWADAAPDALIAYTSQLPDGPVLDALMRNVARKLGEKNPAQAAIWLIERATSKTAQNELTSVFDNLTTHEPGNALQLLRETPTDSSAHSAALAGVVNGLIKTDPVRAAATLLAEGSPAEQQKHVRSLAYRWTKLDPNAATAWASALPPGELRDTALVSLANPLSETNTAATLALRTLAQTDEARHDITRFALRGIQIKDTRRAQAALDVLSLSPQERARLQTQLIADR
ncbi:MAG: hypothetical protein ABII82_02390 [Verrucomicrobiota bacterium]